MNSNADVAVIKCDNYELETIKEAIKKTINQLGGAQSFVNNGGKVLLKPNMVSNTITGTTHPKFVQAIAEFFMNAGAKIYLTDSPMTHTLDEVAKFNGITDVCNNLGIEMIPVSEIKKTTVDNPKSSEQFYLPTILDEMDLVINIAKIKAHPLTVFSGSVKNIFGLCPGLTKSQFHLQFKKNNDFCHMLVDLYSIEKPGLTIVEGIDGIDNSGNTRKIGLILGSKDAIALDATVCRIVGIPPDLVLTTKYGAERNLGVMEKENIRILGDSINFPLLDDFEYVVNRPEVLSSIAMSIFDSIFSRNVISKPYVTKKCERCGLCVKVCAKNAITLNDKTAQIDYGKCIRCYCCQEICPNQAVLIRQPNPAFRKLTNIVQYGVIVIRSLESKKLNQKE
jgi:uncharacterized protein (DUF362 family)/Pyruvate/2-oxoacid:ferredoxin oxidoreductase delta subunit